MALKHKIIKKESCIRETLSPKMLGDAAEGGLQIDRVKTTFSFSQKTFSCQFSLQEFKEEPL